MTVLDLGAVRWAEWTDRAASVGTADLVLVPQAAAPATMPLLWSLLEPRERAAAERPRDPAGQAGAVISRAVLRLLLSDRCGCSPGQLRLGTGPHGKPFLADAPVASSSERFNLSHAGGWLIYAFADCEIGVDIEAMRPRPDLDALAGRALWPRERSIYRRLHGEARLAFLYRAWVAKEALLKMTGEGLAMDPADLDLMTGEVAPAAAAAVEPRVRLFTPRAGHVAAVAATRRLHALRFRRVSRVDDLVARLSDRR